LQGTAQRKQSKIEDGRQAASAEGAQSLTASTPWHDEGTASRHTSPRSHPGIDKRSAQVEASVQIRASGLEAG
jgi:hypothetical protein